MVLRDSAPCGHIATQCPQLMQSSSASWVEAGTGLSSFNSIIRIGHAAAQMPSRLHFSLSTLMTLIHSPFFSISINQGCHTEKSDFFKQSDWFDKNFTSDPGDCKYKKYLIQICEVSGQERLPKKISWEGRHRQV
jgi:hypothetical protein